MKTKAILVRFSLSLSLSFSLSSLAQIFWRSSGERKKASLKTDHSQNSNSLSLALSLRYFLAFLFYFFNFNLRENKVVKFLFGCSKNGGKENKVILFWDPFFFFAFIIRKMKKSAIFGLS